MNNDFFGLLNEYDQENGSSQNEVSYFDLIEKELVNPKDEISKEFESLAETFEIDEDENKKDIQDIETEFRKSFANNSVNKESKIEANQTKSKDTKKETKDNKKKSKIVDNDATKLCKFIVQRYQFLADGKEIRIYCSGYYKVIDCNDFVEIMMVELLNARPVDQIRTYPSVATIKEAFKILKVFIPNNDEVLARIEQDNSKIAFNNVIYDARNRKVRKHSPRYCVLSKVNANYLESGNIESEIFNRFCSNSCPEGEYYEYKQCGLEIIGDSLASIRFKKFHVMLPAPDSGKSVLCEFIQKIREPTASTNFVLNKLSDSYSLAELSKCSVAIAAETEPGALKSSAVQRLKSLTGDYMIPVRQIYQEPKNVRNTCTIIVSTNFPIELRYEDDAFWNRIHIMPFIRSVDKEIRDPQLVDKMLKERDEICSLAVRALSDVIERDYQFLETKTAKKLKQRMMDRSYTGTFVMKFVHDCCIVDESFGVYEFTSDLYEAYCEYCSKLDVFPADADNIGSFSKSLASNLGEQIRKTRQKDEDRKSQRAYRGLRLRRDNCEM